MCMFALKSADMKGACGRDDGRIKSANVPGKKVERCEIFDVLFMYVYRSTRVGKDV